MTPLQCQYCGNNFVGQETTCVRCGAPRPMPFPQPVPGQPAYTFAPPQKPAPGRNTSPWAIAGCSLLAVIIVGGIVVALLAGFGVFNSLGNVALPKTTGPGWWKATAPGLGTFEFKTNSSQSAITEFAFQIPKITCPDITYSVDSVDVRTDPPWAMSKGQFDADVVISSDDTTGDIDVEVSGTIEATGKQASGNWVFDGEDNPCRGSWTGVPSQ
ncbi:MAG TPA: hypothetical protein VKT82_33130 [Ktedonobacterales bacterium]|nr:hypothetical protein [Ktedonobacterales bacterium]